MWRMYVLVCLMMAAACGRVNAQANEIIQLGLNIEKLAQLKSILSNMKRGYEIVSKGYHTVKNISEGNFSLHQAFLDKLLQVSPAVRNYWKVKEIVSLQIGLIRGQKQALRAISSSGGLNAAHLHYVEGVMNNVVEGSLQHLDDLVMVLTAGSLRMNDLERIETIDRIHEDMSSKMRFMREFHESNLVYMAQGARLKNDLRSSKVYYGAEK